MQEVFNNLGDCGNIMEMSFICDLIDWWPVIGALWFIIGTYFGGYLFE